MTDGNYSTSLTISEIVARVSVFARVRHSFVSSKLQQRFSRSWAVREETRSANAWFVTDEN
jgi:hypothetical protein